MSTGNESRADDFSEITQIPGFEKRRDIKEFTKNNKGDVERSLFTNKTRKCPLSTKLYLVTYKNPVLLRKYTSTRGKILAPRITFVKAQKKLKLSIKRARFLALLPYINY